MPFKSLKQEKWAFATHQPFAKEWADKTDQKSLRKSKNTQYKRNLRRLGLKNKKAI